jgi:hypothetical protein
MAIKSMSADSALQDVKERLVELKEEQKEYKEVSSPNIHMIVFFFFFLFQF